MAQTDTSLASYLYMYHFASGVLALECYNLTASLVTASRPHGQLIGSFGELMTQCGLGPCTFQKSSPSLGAWCSRPLGAHESKGGRDTWRGCAEQ